MADAASLLARLQAARNTVRVIDPTTGDVRDIAVNPPFASSCRPDTVWVPIVSNIGVDQRRTRTLKEPSLSK